MLSGVRLNPQHILACASLGLSKVAVKARPRVVIISTGSELVSPEEQKLEPGMIRNSTGPFLVAAARRMGLEVDFLGIVRDDPALYRQRLEAALQKGADLVLSTGAVSMGQYDFVADVLSQMGARTLFHKAAIRPGKPILVAELGASHGRALFFGVPGNPVSTAVGLRFFADPYLRATLGLARENPIRAVLSREISKPEGLRCFFKGRARLSEKGLEVEALKGQASYVVSALLEANCWVVLPESGDHVAAGDIVEIFPLHNSFEAGVLS
jgi:molybdopterin molybdotransferase